MQQPPAVGEIRGLNQAVLEYLANYKVAGEGLNGISNCVIALPIPDWSLWSWLERGTSASVAAGTAANVGVFTVPTDERVYLDSVIVLRTTGDNVIDYIYWAVAAGYGNGDLTSYLLRLTTPAVPIYWPYGQQAINQGIGGPLLMEPGTSLSFRTSNVGVAASTFDYLIGMRRTKLIRALAPP